MRRGSHLDPVGKEGLGKLTASLLRHGVKGLTFDELNEDLEGRAISIEAGDGGDNTRVSGSCMTDQIEHALLRTRQILREPTFPADEFAKLKEQTVSNLALARENPGSVATNELNRVLFGSSPLGREMTPESVEAITLDDVRSFYQSVYKPNDAILIIAGDVDTARGQALAEKLLADWPAGQLPDVDYTLPSTGDRKIILVDNPAGKQSVLRIGLRAYDNRDENRFAGSVAGQILSAGIESRLGKYVRAEKGYVYGIAAYFQPGRHAGQFSGFTETGFETTYDTIEAMYKVFNDLRTADVTTEELSSAKTRVAGSLVMETQTIQQQAGRRADGILNGYPADYYDKLPARINQVTQDQIRTVMNQYVKDDQFHVVVVAPAEKVKDKLAPLGTVEVLPMPAKRTGATTQSTEMLK
jgi:predicted Zn-dependent peptidase